MDALMQQFLAEGRDLAEQAGDALLALEHGQGEEALAAALRAFHTLKGSAGLFDLAELGAMMHAAEGRLEEVRGDGARPPAELVTLLLEAVSETEGWLGALERDGEPSPADRASASRLARALAQDPAADIAIEAPAAGPPDWALDLATRLGPGEAGLAIRHRPEAQAYFRGQDPLAMMAQVPALKWLGLARGRDEPAGDAYDPFQCDLVLTGLSLATAAEAQKVYRFVRDEVELVEIRGRQASIQDASRALRIAPERIDELAALLDETIIAKNALAHATAALGEDDRLRAVGVRQAALDRSLSDLHAAVAELRMAPLASMFARFPRQARDLAAQLGKQAELQVSGGEVAVDKAVAEGLFEPLVHLLRNALDHGVEAPEERAARGKAARAALTLSARADGGQAVIELADDGAGLDLARIRAVAVTRGLLSGEAAEALSDELAHDLLFTPGFSTADRVTDVSGRGVGLDAVRVAMARLGGRISLRSRLGEGTIAQLIVPLRAVMTKIAVVSVNGRRYGAPLQSIREVVRLERAHVTSIRAGRAFVLRGEVLPLVSLSEAMGGAPTRQDPVTVVVVGQGAQAIGVEVDRVAERIEAPVRPAAGLLSALPGLQGTLVEGDGQVLMVLDLEALTA